MNARKKAKQLKKRNKLLMSIIQSELLMRIIQSDPDFLRIYKDWTTPGRMTVSNVDLRECVTKVPFFLSWSDEAKEYAKDKACADLTGIIKKYVEWKIVSFEGQCFLEGRLKVARGGTSHDG